MFRHCGAKMHADLLAIKLTHDKVQGVAALASCRYMTHMSDMVHPTDDQKPITIQMRVSAGFLHAVDAWRRQQPDLPSRSEAIRRLVADGVQAHQRKGA